METSRIIRRTSYTVCAMTLSFGAMPKRTSTTRVTDGRGRLNTKAKEAMNSYSGRKR